MDSVDYKAYKVELEKALHSDPEREKSLSLALIKYAKQHNDQLGLLIGYTYMMDYSLSQRDFVKSQHYMSEALSIPSHIYKEEQMRLYIHCGLYHYFISDAHKAIDFYCKALHISEEIHHIERRGAIYNNIALIFHQYKIYKEALHYYLEAYHYMELSSSEYKEQSCSIILCNMISCYLLLDDLENAKKYFTTYQQIAPTSPMTLCLKASIAHVSKEYEHALSYIETLYQQMNKCYFDVYLQYTMLEEISRIMLDIGTQEQAIEAITRLYEVSNRQNAGEMLVILSYYKTYVEKYNLLDELPEIYRSYYTLTQTNNTQKDTLHVKSYRDQILLDQMIQLNKTLQQSAFYDTVSGLRNRNCYENDMTAFMKTDTIQKLGIMLCDIDNFKDYNDEHGHSYGDKILHKLGITLLQYVDKDIIPYRYGGDEFLCLLINKSESEIQHYVDSVYELLKADDHITISVGIATLPKDTIHDISDLLNEADHALYMAKKTGKNKHIKYRTEQ